MITSFRASTTFWKPDENQASSNLNNTIEDPSVYGGIWIVPVLRANGPSK